MSFLARAIDEAVDFSVTASVSRMMPRDWCPRCEAYTHWHLSIWNEHTRCLDCGQNPLQPSPETESA